MRARDWNRILAGLTLAPIPIVAAYAETYLNEVQAGAALFPGVALNPSEIVLSKEEEKAIEKAAKESVIDDKVKVYWGPNKEALFIDRVVGKHEYITYAVAINPDGKVKGIEIMDYRETYGYEVRAKDWRNQFVGKSAQDPIKIDKDIQNISGATLSSVHVTNGVRRVLKTYEIIKAKA